MGRGMEVGDGQRMQCGVQGECYLSSAETGGAAWPTTVKIAVEAHGEKRRRAGPRLVTETCHLCSLPGESLPGLTARALSPNKN